MCDQLAQQLRSTGISVALGAVCGAPAAPVAVGALDTVPANRNYRWRIEQEQGHAIGILTIRGFVDPQDPGWAGFATAMTDLATTDLLIVDLQNAGGDDPRAGFAVIAALGLEDYARSSYRAPMFRDTPLAKTIRANVTPAIPARSRTLWSSFSAEGDLVRIAREVVPGIIRTKRPLAMRMLVGPGCGRACQLVVRLVRFQGADLFGSFADASDDELGAIRLPHTGIVARFPTASYGPYVIGPLEERSLPKDYAKSLLAGLHNIATTRAAAFAWRTRKLPSCATLPASRAVVRKRVHECLPDPLPAKMMLRQSTKVEAPTATRFFATYPQLVVHASQDEGILGESSVTVSGTPEAISRALQAPFGVHATWGCEPELD